MAEQQYEHGLSYQVALLIDGDNLTGQSWAVLTEHARNFGYLAVARLYMDFQTLNDGGLAARSSGFELVHVLGKRSVNGYKSMVDVSLASDAMSILYENPNITTLVIGTGDADFIPLLRHWKRRGRRVVVMANDAKLSGELRQVADEVVTFHGGKNSKKRRGKASRPSFTRAQLRDMIIEVVGNTRLTDRETDQPLVRVDWLMEELIKNDAFVEESIGSEKALIDILSDMPEFA
ncbi:MAG: NYN domain-containing protein, partial [Myxococcota bacterium]